MPPAVVERIPGHEGRSHRRWRREHELDLQVQMDVAQPHSQHGHHDRHAAQLLPFWAGFSEKSPIKLPVGEPVRAYVLNAVEYDPMASFHLQPSPSPPIDHRRVRLGRW